MTANAQREYEALQRVKCCEDQLRTIRSRASTVEFKLAGLRNWFALHPEAMDRGPDALFRALAEADGSLRAAEELIDRIRRAIFTTPSL
jgi:hypothetical protein